MVIARSADGVTVVERVDELLAGLGSVVVDDTDAVFDSDTPCAGAVTTTVMAGADVPVARVGSAQVTDTLPTFVQVHPVPDAETKVTPAGKVSETDRAAASEGPAFATAKL